MSRTPKDIIESAQIDGAGMRVEMLKIVFPLCWPTISMLIILNTAGIFTATGPVLLLTKGKYGTPTISYWIFDQINTHQNYYTTSAAGLVFTAVLLPVVLFVRWALGKVYADVEF